MKGKLKKQSPAVIMVNMNKTAQMTPCFYVANQLACFKMTIWTPLIIIVQY